jgi:DNA-binding GntR family transcriptional regulator
MTPSNVRPAPTNVQVQRLSRREEVYLALRAALMDGSISPWERLGEIKLAERFNASRTPVREALARLESDGLVRKRGGGLYAYMPSLRDLVELYELRITLELQGIRRCIDDPALRHDPVILRNEMEKWYMLRDDLPEPDAGFVSKDEGFHTELLRSSGNTAMTDALVAVNRQIRPVRMYDYLTADRVEATVVEHIDIGEKVLGGRLREGLEALHEHVGNSRDVVMKRAARAMAMANMANGYRDQAEGLHG